MRMFALLTEVEMVLIAGRICSDAGGLPRFLRGFKKLRIESNSVGNCYTSE